MILLFVYSNYSIWNSINSVPIVGNEANLVHITISNWNPFGVVWHHYAYSNGNLGISDAIFSAYNFPFWLFFIAIALNLYFMARLAKNKTERPLT